MTKETKVYKIWLPEDSNKILEELLKHVGKHVVTGCLVPAEYSERGAPTEDFGGDCGILQDTYIDGGIVIVDSDWGMSWAVFPQNAWIEVDE